MQAIMANLADSLIGRVALWNKAAYVEITHYDKENDSYNIVALKRPEHVCTPDVPAVVHRIIHSVEFFPPKPFHKRFPAAQVIDGGSGCANRHLYGHILDISSNFPNDLIFDNEFQISTSCIVKGARQESNRTHPLTCITCRVSVHLNHPNDIVEFEDIHFRGGSSVEDNNVLCTAGKTIVFRRCRFSSSEATAVLVTSRPCISKKVVTPINVIFENCTFANCAGRPICVNYPGNVMLLNCLFHSNEREGGVAVYDGGSVVAKHCIFHDEIGGSAVCGLKATLDLQYCTLTRFRKYAVKVLLGGSATFKECILSHASGILVKGPKRSKLLLEECKLVGLSAGINVKTGKTDIIVNGCNINCDKYALRVHFDVIGNIDFVNTTITSVDSSHLLYSGPKCLITMDGATIPPLSLDQISEIVNQISGHFDLAQLRRNKKGGVGVVECFQCNKVEPKYLRYQKCGRCKSVCYCSRACQVLFNCQFSLLTAL